MEKVKESLTALLKKQKRKFKKKVGERLCFARTMSS